MTRGFCYVAYGPHALRERELSERSLRTSGNALPVAWVGDGGNAPFEHVPGYTNVQMSRWAKASIDLWSPFDRTCYLDADTRVRGSLDVGFEALAGGWDVAIAPSRNQGDTLLAHVRRDEKQVTLEELGQAFPTNFQFGVFWLRKCEAVARLFAALREEWLRWKDQDQAALLRALHREPVRVWLLGTEFNGGEVVEHLFGRAR
jgi:hypothetical protein